MIRALIIGVTGRMGRALLRAAADSAELQVSAGIASPGSPHLGQDLGELAGGKAQGACVTSDLAAALSGCDVAIDFSSPQATVANVAACRAARRGLLLGTTGYSEAADIEFDHAARVIPLLVAPNTSIGVTLLLELVRLSARSLPPDFDIEIVESHHRLKRDAPSGTALALHRAAADGRDLPADAKPQTHADLRRCGDIGVAVVRGGDLVGEHSVLFAGAGEQLILTHRATDRAVFARGAVKAASWLGAQPAGRYFMRDLLYIKQ